MKELQNLLKRPADCNKGDFGHVLIIGGDYGMGGAAIMAAEAAYRAGAGKVSILSRNENYAAILARLPNAMTVFEEKNPEKIFANKTVIAIGMGLGKSGWSKNFLKASLQCNLPKIIDADALNLISESKKNLNLENCIITPHAAEAARLLGFSIDKILEDRKAAAQKLYEKFGAITVLKGKDSLICGKNFLHICKFGNAGMATAGMGDALSGIIAGLVAQKLNLKDAAVFGVELHAKAGDLVVKKQGEIGMMPQDVIAALPLIINAL